CGPSPPISPECYGRTAAGAQAVESPKSSRCGVSLSVATLLPTLTVSTRSNTPSSALLSAKLSNLAREHRLCLPLPVQRYRTASIGPKDRAAFRLECMQRRGCGIPERVVTADRNDCKLWLNGCDKRGSRCV